MLGSKVISYLILTPSISGGIFTLNHCPIFLYKPEAGTHCSIIPVFHHSNYEHSELSPAKCAKIYLTAIPDVAGLFCLTVYQRK